MFERTVGSVTQFIDTVLELKADWEPEDPYPEIWYRGVNDADHKLLPGAYWRSNCDEISLVLSFRARAPFLIERPPEDDWQWYFLMQHYGLPTRLLDWTESPLHGLHFALHTLASGRMPCVWVLDPIALNQTTFGEGAIFMPSDGPIDGDLQYWLPVNCGRHAELKAEAGKFGSNELPLAVYPRQSNPRIFTQRGVFTIHGMKEVPLEDVNIRNSAGEERLARILVQRERRLQILDELWVLGLNQTATYPEPQSVAEDLKRMYRVS